MARQKRIRRIGYALGVLILIPLVTWGLSRLRPAAPTVDSAVWIDTVKRGEMLRQVRGMGTLVPEEIRWIPAATEGRVEQILLRSGAVVQSESIILVLSNPELERTALDAQLQLKAVEAELANLRVQLESQLLNQRAAAATIEADFRQAKLQAEVDDQLYKEGLTSDLNQKRSRLRAEELATRHELEQKRLAMAAEAIRAQLDVQKARVDQLRALAELRSRQLDLLRVRAGMPGVLQQVPVEVGQQVAPGTNLARVSNPSRLKAEVRVPETQAKDVKIGQVATVDTRNGTVAGRVVRIDLAAQQGTVAVDIGLEGTLPPGARPDLNVDATIEIERLTDVLFVGRPVQGQPDSTVGLFKVAEDGREAVLVPVKLGRTSVNTVEVVQGLQVGDRVILSDMSNWANFDRVRLK
jgi:HlyD family secretion protein